MSHRTLYCVRCDARLVSAFDDMTHRLCSACLRALKR